MEKTNKPKGDAPKGGASKPQNPFVKPAVSLPANLTEDQKRIARGLLANYNLHALDSVAAKKLLEVFTAMNLNEAGLRWALQDAGVEPNRILAMARSAKTSTNNYVMTDAVKNGINVREKATSESKLLYMLAKVDAMHPVITITKFSDDKLWGFMETGDKEKNGWIYMEYVKHI